MNTYGYASQMYLLDEVLSTTVQLCSLCSYGGYSILTMFVVLLAFTGF